MTIAEEKAETYLAARHAQCPELALTVDGWAENDIKDAYAAGYAAAERYRLILQAAIRNATPQPER